MLAKKKENHAPLGHLFPHMIDATSPIDLPTTTFLHISPPNNGPTLTNNTLLMLSPIASNSDEAPLIRSFTPETDSVNWPLFSTYLIHRWWWHDPVINQPRTLRSFTIDDNLQTVSWPPPSQQDHPQPSVTFNTCNTTDHTFGEVSLQSPSTCDESMKRNIK